VEGKFGAMERLSSLFSSKRHPVLRGLPAAAVLLLERGLDFAGWTNMTVAVVMWSLALGCVVVFFWPWVSGALPWRSAYLWALLVFVAISSSMLGYKLASPEKFGQEANAIQAWGVTPPNYVIG